MAVGAGYNLQFRQPAAALVQKGRAPGQIGIDSAHKDAVHILGGLRLGCVKSPGKGR